MVTLRTAKPGDAEAAVEVVRRSITELCAADHKGDPDTLAKWLSNKTPEDFLSWLGNADNFCALAVEGDAILGVALVNRGGEISLFYLAPNVQRRGIGRALYAALEEQARKWNLESLHLNSTVGARAFYEALGFKPTGCSKRHFDVMSCDEYRKPLRP